MDKIPKPVPLSLCVIILVAQAGLEEPACTSLQDGDVPVWGPSHLQVGQAVARGGDELRGGCAFAGAWSKGVISQDCKILTLKSGTTSSTHVDGNRIEVEIGGTMYHGTFNGDSIEWDNGSVWKRGSTTATPLSATQSPAPSTTASTTSVAITSTRSVCEETLYLAPQGQSCARGDKIDNADFCKAAAIAMGMPFGAVVENEAWLPGCFYLPVAGQMGTGVAGAGQVSFNAAVQGAHDGIVSMGGVCHGCFESEGATLRAYQVKMN